jgi:hypothetical protein
MTTAHDAPKQCKIGFQPVALFSDRSSSRRRSRYRSVAVVESVFGAAEMRWTGLLKCASAEND